MNKPFSVVTTVVLVVMLTSACGQPAQHDSSDCTRMWDVQLRANPLARLTTQNSQWWVANNYAVPWFFIRKNSYEKDKAISFDWETVDRLYNLYFAASIKNVSVRWKSDSPTIASFAKCVGMPSYFRAFSDGNGRYSYDLWYPPKGIVARGYYSDVDKSLTALRLEMPVSTVIYVEIGSLSHVVSNAFYRGDTATFLNIEGSLRAWPTHTSDATFIAGAIN